MNESQRNRIAPYWEVIKLGHEQKTWIGGTEALKTMNAVNIEIGNAPTSFNCPACVFELLRAIYYSYGTPVRN